MFNLTSLRYLPVILYIEIMIVTGYEDCCFFATVSTALLTNSAGIKCMAFLTVKLY